jgi:hypothetical protein
VSLRQAGASGIAVPFFFNTPLVCFNASGVVAQHLLPSPGIRLRAHRQKKGYKLRPNKCSR